MKRLVKTWGLERIGKGQASGVYAAARLDAVTRLLGLNAKWETKRGRPIVPTLCLGFVIFRVLFSSTMLGNHLIGTYNRIEETCGTMESILLDDLR